MAQPQSPVSPIEMQPLPATQTSITSGQTPDIVSNRKLTTVVVFYKLLILVGSNTKKPPERELASFQSEMVLPSNHNHH
jgi:hypothetical protein